MSDLLNEQVIAVLDRTIELIEKGWTKDANARTKDGIEISWKDEAACQFCLLGAMTRAEWDLGLYGAPGVDGWVRNRIEFALPLNVMSMIDFNDHRAKSKKDVLDILKKAKESVN